MSIPLLDSIGDAFNSFLYFNTPGRAVDYLENLTDDSPYSGSMTGANSGAHGADLPESDRLDLLRDFLPSADDTRDVDPAPSGKRVGGSPLEPSTIDYLNAEYAQHYGMDRATAYQEALANTSYQRAVADMQAAGLNPAAIFGGGRGSGANVVSGKAASSGGGSGGSKSDGFGLSDSAGLIGSAVTFVSQILTDNDGVSKAAGNAAKELVKTVDKYFSK